MYISRYIEKEVISSLEDNPVSAILGPRQCGKSTLAKKIIEQYPNSTYLDLERPSDLNKLKEAEWYLSQQKDKLICIDEIQRKPDLFPLIRSLSDEWGKNGSFLILGSASQELIRQSSESLAGRISYNYLYPFVITELNGIKTTEEILEKGGYPRSILKSNSSSSFKWREDFITTYLEKDLGQWSGFSVTTMRRLLQMLAHCNGQTVNYSSIGNSLNVSHSTIRNYVDLLSGTFIVDAIQPFFKNTGKRLIKSPKIYISDCGLSNCLLGISAFTDLLGHQSLGAVWESLVLSNLKTNFSRSHFYFYRTNHGNEIDFIMELKGKIIAIECKASTSPQLNVNNYKALDDIQPDLAMLVAPIEQGWLLKDNLHVASINEAIALIQNIKEDKVTGNRVSKRQR